MKRGILTGLGGRGLWWLGPVRQRKDCELVAYVEPNPQNRARAVADFGVPEARIYASLDDAIGSVKADFVLDVTPPAVHHRIAERAFAAGLHVIGEKPLSDNFDTAKRVAAAGAQAGVRHMITQNYRFGPQPRATRKWLADGLIGQPGQCDVRFYMPWADSPGSHYVTQPYMLINDMMVHHFDMMRYVLGQDPVSVQAITWNHPWGWHVNSGAHAIVFKYASGLVGTHVSVGCAVGSQSSWNGDWRIEGPQGSLSWDNTSRVWHHHLHRTTERVHRELFPAAVPPGDQAMLTEFFAAIDENREPECSAQDNLKSLAMVFGAIESAQTGVAVSINTP
jgi:predicted dehydrogenase